MSEIVQKQLPGVGEPATNPTEVQPWHTLTPHQAGRALGVSDFSRGLSGAEAQQRLEKFGPNRLQNEKRESLWEVILEEVREPMILLLIFTGILYSILGELSDGLTIFAVILIVVGIEIFNERRAETAIAGLNKLAEPTASVYRDGQVVELPVEEVVPGDTILLQEGRRVGADARLLEAYSLAVDESALTGEAMPVEKEAGLTLVEDTPLAERRNLVFANTTVTRGKSTALVVATGPATEVGRVARLANQVKPPRTPLQLAMREITGWLIWLALGFSLIVPMLSLLLAHQPLQQVILTGLSLAFATIPEELPILITMVLALGAYRLSRQKAIVKRLRAVETLGAVTVVATDKTGTLTENRMEVARIYPEGAVYTQRLLEIGAVCNDASYKAGDQKEGEFVGDPVDTALLRAASKAGLEIERLRQTYPLHDEFTFDNTRKRMSVVLERDGRLWVAVKGAPEEIMTLSTRRLVVDADADGDGGGADEEEHVVRSGPREEPLSESDRQSILLEVNRLAGEGQRVLALAEKTVPIQANNHLSEAEAEADLTFVGLVGLADPPRPEVKKALADCHTAGIRTIMITGDHPLTAASIAREVGLVGRMAGPAAPQVMTGPELDRLSGEELQEVVGRVTVYARTTPEHKLKIVQALRGRGELIAVTGDGINDAPALAAADIGVAMGETGTDVAREAADMILADDNFTTIVRAVKEGRVLFANLTKAVRYYLACKVALILSTLLPALLAVPVPFAPVQIILMELFMDVAASSTFVAEPTEEDLMRRPPRDPKQPFMNRGMISSIFVSAIGLFGAVTLAYLVTWYSGAGIGTAQTVAFVTWMVGHVLLALNLRSEREPLFRLGLFSNRLMLVWAGATVVFVLLITFMPWVQGIFKTVGLSAGQWGLALGAALVGTFWLELRKLLFYRGA